MLKVGLYRIADFTIRPNLKVFCNNLANVLLYTQPQPNAINFVYCVDGSIIHIAYLHWLAQASMDLPPDKAKLLKSYDADKKWELICDQVCSRYLVLQAA